MVCICLWSIKSKFRVLYRFSHCSYLTHLSSPNSKILRRLLRLSEPRHHSSSISQLPIYALSVSLPSEHLSSSSISNNHLFAASSSSCAAQPDRFQAVMYALVHQKPSRVRIREVFNSSLQVSASSGCKRGVLVLHPGLSCLSCGIAWLSHQTSASILQSLYSFTQSTCVRFFKTCKPNSDHNQQHAQRHQQE